MSTAADKKPDLKEFHRLASISGSSNKPCQVGAALKSLPKDDRVNLEGALSADKGEIPNATILLWLKQRKLVVSPPAVTAHRSQVCRCAKEAILNGLG